MANERATRTQQELDQAERWMREDTSERRPVVWALAIALVLHAGILAARMPGWSDPVRMEKPEEEVAMKVQFLQPPPPPPPPEAPPPEPPRPEKKKIARPDPKPDEPEPIVTPPPRPPEPPRDYVPSPVPAPPAPAPAPPAPAPAPAPPEQMGPIRVSPGQGPGIIKKVEPLYPPMAKTARLQGTVVLDAIILKDGTVSNVSVVKSANPMFDKAAMNALSQWRFSPSQQDVIMSLTVHFKLD
jgi:periplasmic protein TonB